MKTAAFPEEALQLRIQIREIKPAIFRVIQVTNTRTFHLLHEIIQWSFGWDHAHLHEFHVGRTKVAEPDPGFGQPPFPRHPRTTRLGDLVSKDVTRFTYVYDLGDDWIHDIIVEKRFAPDLVGAQWELPGLLARTDQAYRYRFSPHSYSEKAKPLLLHSATRRTFRTAADSPDGSCTRLFQAESADRRSSTGSA